MRTVAITAAAALLALAVVWLLSKMTRTDEADWLLVKLGIGLGVAVLTFVGALVIGRNGTGDPSS